MTSLEKKVTTVMMVSPLWSLYLGREGVEE